MLRTQLKGKRIILGSQSPRRHQLMTGLDVDFEIQIKDTDESWPKELKRGAVPEYIALKKSEAFGALGDDTILITADTTVWLNDRAVNKPTDADEAREMLAELSGATHHVYTGVAIRDKNGLDSFYDETGVTMRKFDSKMIDYYVDNYSPLDKAGAYGAQDWIGYVGIERLEGCYYNVMGLPVREVWKRLLLKTSQSDCR